MQEAVAPAITSIAPSDTAWLQLLQLADSALPIGAMAHSFGIETLTAEADLTESDLPIFFSDWICGTGLTEASFCLRAHAVADAETWRALNEDLSAFKPARETREGSLRLGRRFLALATDLLTAESETVESPWTSRLRYPGDAHLATAFGLVGAALGMDPETVATAYLHQSLSGAISACQRLLPFGQSAAMRLLWNLKPSILSVVRQAQAEPDELWSLQPMLEIGSMRHPHLHTRLFIS